MVRPETSSATAMKMMRRGDMTTPSRDQARYGDAHAAESYGDAERHRLTHSAVEIVTNWCAAGRRRQQPAERRQLRRRQNSAGDRRGEDQQRELVEPGPQSGRGEQLDVAAAEQAAGEQQGAQREEQRPRGQAGEQERQRPPDREDQERRGDRYRIAMGNEVGVEVVERGGNESRGQDEDGKPVNPVDNACGIRHGALRCTPPRAARELCPLAATRPKREPPSGGSRPVERSRRTRISSPSSARWRSS